MLWEHLFMSFCGNFTFFIIIIPLFFHFIEISFSTEELFSFFLCLQVFSSAFVTVLLWETIGMSESLLI